MGGDRIWKPSRTPSRPVTSDSSSSSNNFNQATVPQLSAAQMLEFLQEGLLATKSTGSRQAFVNNLATEAGLARIRQIVETDFSPSYRVLNPMFQPHCVLFLRLISNEEIRQSLVLEKAVGTIYNVIYEHNGNRGVLFFRKIADCLIQMAPKAEGGNTITARDEVSQAEEALMLAMKAWLVP